MKAKGSNASSITPTVRLIKLGKGSPALFSREKTHEVKRL